MVKPIKIILLSLGISFAFSFYGNQSTIKWKTVDSDNFRVHYPQEYQKQIAPMVFFAEEVHDSVVSRYRVALPSKVDLVLRNALFSNGFANPVHNLMNIWLTDWDNKLRSTHSWLSDVVTHEFSHLVSIQAGAKLPPWVQALQFSYQDFYNDPVQTSGVGVYPLTVFPLWFAEGTAQYESARLGFDAWDTHRDMLLRTAILEDQLLEFPKMDEYSDHALHSELGPYNQGFSLVLYLAEKYGDMVVPKLWSELSQFHRLSFSAALQRVIGVSEKDLYAQWKTDKILHYQGIKDSLGFLHAGEKLTGKSFWHDFIQWDNDFLYGVSNFSSAWFDGGIFAISADSLEQRTKNGQGLKSNLSANLAKKFPLKKAWLEQGISVKNGRIAYVTYEKRDAQGRAYFDIALDDSTKSNWWGKRPNRRLLTEFTDAVYPDISPQGDGVVFVRREVNGSRFILSKVKIPESDELPEVVDLLLPPTEALAFNFYTPRWSPDGSKIVFSFFDGKRRQVGVVDSAGSTFSLISSGSFDARDPVWSKDGKSVILASDSTGVFNLWQYFLDDLANPVPLSNVVGGAFNPALQNDSMLTYVGYDSSGFSLYQLNYQKKIPALKNVKNPTKNHKIVLEHREMHGAQRDYSALPNIPVLLPILSVEAHADEVSLGIFKGKPVYKAGFAMGLSDALQKNQVELALLLEVGRGFKWINQSGLNPELHSDLMVNWENRSFPWTWGLGFYRSNVATRDTVRYEDPRSYDDSLAISNMGVSFSTLQGDWGYSLFKQGDTLMFSLASQSARFNLFEDGFAWDYLKRKQLNLFAGWLDEEFDGFSGNIDGAGKGILLGTSVARSNLFRPGTFRESFTVSAQGAITPVYRVFDTQEFLFASWWSSPLPWLSKTNLALGARLSGVMAWQGHSAATDTLDHFFHHSLYMEGYPLLANSENYALHGDRTAHLQAYYLFPIVNEINKNWWILSAKSLWGSVFAHLGNAWWDQKSWAKQMWEKDAWKRSWGVEIRFSSSMFRQMPMEISLSLAKSLDSVTLQDENWEVPTIGAGWLPDLINPTTLRFNVGFQFANGWQGHHPKKFFR
ncbi:MAG: hypothetical protein GX801_04105 [Fibrobacter sp.]|nr:hypothetical protein [Fibrobacter sp.]